MLNSQDAITVVGRRIHYGQPAPKRACSCWRARWGRTCYDHRCSLRSRDSWARREACVDAAVWRLHIDDGLDHLYMGA